MKKFFTLACAAIVAISASAFTPMKMERKAKKDFQLTDLELKAESELKVEKHVRPAFQMPAKQNIRKAPAATQDFTPAAPVTAEAISWDSYYGDASWSINFYDADENSIGGLELFGTSTASTITGTYTVDLNNYCYVEFVRAEGDTLTSLVDGETFEITYVSESIEDGEVLTTYHVNGDLSTGTETIHMDFDFTVAGGIDYLWYMAYYQDGSIVGVQYPLYMYCMYMGLYCEYEDYVWVQLKDYMYEPVVVTGDTVEFYSPLQLMPEVKYYADVNLNRLVFRSNEAILAPQDTASILAAVYFTADSLEEGTFSLLEQEKEYVFYNTVIVMHNGDTTNIDLNIYEESSVVITKSGSNNEETHIQVFFAGRDGKVYTTENVYYMPTVATDSLIYAYQYNGGWSAPGATVDTTYYESDGDIMFGAYGLELDAQSYIQGAYWLTLDVVVTDETAVGNYTMEDVLANYCEFYNAWEGYGLNILNLEFEIKDLDGDNFGDIIIGSVYANDGLIHPFIMPFVNPYAPAPTAIRNSSEAVKAVKMIENGQVIIRRGDRVFNALGKEISK